MATGFDKSKLKKSENKRSINLSQTKEGTHSSKNLKTNRLDSIPNNWDFRDWQSSVNDSRQYKKANREPPRDKTDVRNVSQSLYFTSPTERRHHTPATYPRTKFTYPSEKADLERIKQRINFSDVDDIKENKELEHRDGENAVKNQHDLNTLTVSKNSKQGKSNSKTDSSQIVSRLMEIRDYIKQAMAMMDNLNNNDEPHNSKEIANLRKLIQQLREQERSYMAVLQQMLMLQDESSLLEAGIKQKLDRTSDHNGGTFNLAGDDGLSDDLEVQSVTSEVTTENTVSSSPRPRIEDKLGVTDEDGGDDYDDEAITIENTFIENQSDHDTSQLPEWSVVSEQNVPDTDIQTNSLVKEMHSKTLELESLHEQERILSQLLEQQEQLRALHGRQEALLAMQKDAENQLAKTKSPVGLHTQAGVDPSRGGSDVNDSGSEILMRRRAAEEIEKNYYSQSDTGTDELWHIPVHVEYFQLQDKLHRLQEKKRHMDDMLAELQTQKSQSPNQISLFENKLNKLPRARDARSTQVIAGETEVTMSDLPNDRGLAADTPVETNLKLEEVRSCLEQLQQLMQHYNVLNKSPAKLNQDLNNRTLGASGDRNQGAPRGRDTTQLLKQGDNSVGPNQEQAMLWNCDPEVQSKMKKLNEAQGRLKSLKAMVSQFESVTSSISSAQQQLEDSSFKGLAGSCNNKSLPGIKNLSVRAGGTNRKSVQDKEPIVLQNNLESLQQLDNDQRYLNHFSSNDLISLRKSNYRENAEFKSRMERNNNEVTFDIPKEQDPPPPPTVTFSSNDEIYDKMRKQRMLREELNQKKLELEALMRKDRSKKGYARNQDNQSDNVSTEAFGTSVVSADATMATWGGSTTENLESITEDACADVDEDANDEGNDNDGSEEEYMEEDNNMRSGDTFTVEDDILVRQTTKRGGKKQKRLVPPVLTSKEQQKNVYTDRVQVMEQETSLCHAVLNLSQVIQDMVRMVMPPRYPPVPAKITQPWQDGVEFPRSLLSPSTHRSLYPEDPLFQKNNASQGQVVEPDQCGIPIHRNTLFKATSPTDNVNLGNGSSASGCSNIIIHCKDQASQTSDNIDGYPHKSVSATNLTSSLTDGYPHKSVSATNLTSSLTRGVWKINCSGYNDRKSPQTKIYRHPCNLSGSDAGGVRTSSSFEGLKETIYNEVAHLISKNESQPDFLIKLICELQHISSDNQREKTLSAIESVISQDHSRTSSLTHQKNKRTLNEHLNSIHPSQSFESALSSATDNYFSRDDLGETVIHFPASTQPEGQELQVQNILSYLMPVLRQNADNIFSPKLIACIENIIISLAVPSDSTSEFSQKHMSTKLRKMFKKYEGQRLRDVSDHLVDELTEVLFNELSHYQLFPLYNSLPTTNVLSSTKLVNYGNESDESKSSLSLSDDENIDGVNTSGVMNEKDNMRDSEERPASCVNSEAPSDDRCPGMIVDAEDKDEGAELPYKSAVLELTLGETKPFIRIGSDEDDNDEDNESVNTDDLSETAVSRDARIAKSADIDDDGQPNLQNDRDAECSSLVENTSQFKLIGAVLEADAAAAVRTSENGVRESNGFEEIHKPEISDVLSSFTEDELEKQMYHEQEENNLCEEIMSMADASEIAGDLTYIHAVDTPV